MRFRNWETGGFDRAAAVDFCHQGINPLAAVLLASRGVSDISEAQIILGEQPSETYDPFLMADMDKAAARIRSAIDNREHIAVYGDYDVDGMTSCALLSLWLRSKNADFEVYIPGRLCEGYGLNRAALDLLSSHGASLVVTVDCGITAIDEALYARQLGISLVITDHHECRERLPDADAVVNPKRPDCRYPFKSLAGVGIAYKLVCALEAAGHEGGALIGGGASGRSAIYDQVFGLYGDLVAIGTIADVMPVAGENRELIRRGLVMINNSPRPGLQGLLRESPSERGKVTASTVGYTLAPRLNAAGRMGRPEISVDLLLTNDPAQAETLTAELCRLNNERRSMEAEISEQAMEMLAETGADGPIVLAQRGWHQGVTGIVAARMAERYLMPAVIISLDDNGVGRGSCRSIGAFGIYDALKTCEDILLNYGGHDMAAGVTVASENIDELRRRITACYNDSAASQQGPGLRIDFEVEKPKLLTTENIRFLERLEPFGSGFPTPCLCIKDALVTSIMPIGGGKHTRLAIEKSGVNLDCIFFSMPAEELGISSGMYIDAAFEPQINDFRGRISVQLLLQDVRISRDIG